MSITTDEFEAGTTDVRGDKPMTPVGDKKRCRVRTSVQLDCDSEGRCVTVGRTHSSIPYTYIQGRTLRTVPSRRQLIAGLASALTVTAGCLDSDELVARCSSRGGE